MQRRSYTRAALTLMPDTAAACNSTTRPPQDLELDRAHQATARYADVNQAIADGYTDINVVIPHMGRHFMKQSLLDNTFEPDKPELLVYTPDSTQLVAVEYAVPLAQSASVPPGFAGGADAWDRNETFQLWTLHAWVWQHNLDGVFTAYNPLAKWWGPFTTTDRFLPYPCSSVAIRGHRSCRAPQEPIDHG
jgi:hypothetical protein